MSRRGLHRGLAGGILLALAGTVPAEAQSDADGRGRGAGSPGPRPPVWSYEPDTGLVYQRGDFKLTAWGYAERVWARDGAGSWPRVRQGTEFDFPRVATSSRPVLVYEADFTNTDFFRQRPASQVLEKLYLGLEPVRDDGRFRALVGQNTYILSRESNLSTGNLPTIRRSLILEEHGRVGSFSPQLGAQVRVALTKRYEVAASLGDNRGGFPTGNAHYAPTNAVAAKLTATLLNDRATRRKFTLGAGADYTCAVRADTLPLRPAIGSATLGGAPVAGRKLTIEGDAAYVGRLGPRPYTLEAEALASRYPAAGTSAAGGYAQLQVSLFDTPRLGDLDPFVRYDLVRLGWSAVSGAAVQQAVRTGANYNLPFTDKHASVRLEYAWNRVRGPVPLVLVARRFDEVRVGVRVNAARYVRH